MTDAQRTSRVEKFKLTHYRMIVTIVAYKRPELLARLLESIAEADLQHVRNVVISCDHHSDEMYEQMVKVWQKAFTSDFGSSIIKQPARLGIHNHQRWLYTEAAYEHAQSDQIVALEEDCVVSPDAFNLAHWSLQQPGYKFVNLSHNGRKQVIAQEVAESRVHEDHEFRSSYAWAFTRDFWRELEPQWNGKTRAPYGWDWQVNYLCYREGWKCLTPEVPRAMNTGREGGTYETPETYDRDRTDIVICQTVPHMYSLVRGNQGLGIVRETPEWVKEEMRP